MKRDKRLELILSHVEAKFNRGASTDWKNRDFEDLNFEILKKTKTTISALTLKRIFGKIQTSDDYFPQKATYNALMIYSGLDSSAFESVPESVLYPDQKSEQTDLSANIQSEPTSKQRKFSPYVWAFLFTLLVLGIYFVSNRWQKTVINGQLILKKTEGFNPMTAHFEYSTPNTRDSFHIIFDENFPPIDILPGKGKTSYYYQYPGYFNATLLAGKQVISDTVPILVQTNGWQALAYYFEQKYKERYFPLSVARYADGIFHPTPTEYAKVGMDTNKIVVLRFDNYRPTNVSGDSFYLQTEFKNSDTFSGIRCNSVYLVVCGRNGLVHFRFANPGCSHWLYYDLSEKRENNGTRDMSEFTFDLTKWQTIRIENKNKKVKLYVDNVLKLSDSYSKSIGEIVGVTLIFHGSGYLRSFNLKDIAGKDIFNF